MNIFIQFILSAILTCICLANLPEDPVEYQVWEKKMLEAIEAQKNAPPNESIPKLGKWVFQLSRESSFEQGDRPVFHAAQAALIQIPGHAEYYRDDIKAADARYRSASENDLGPSIAALSDALRYGLQTLEQLPSPETVRVLGDFLYESQGFDEQGNRPEGFVKGTGPIHLWAAKSLHNLPLKNKPLPDKIFISFPQIRTWQLWYQQVKAGNRTFSFEGDPAIYSLEGVVSQVKNPDVPRTAKRPEPIKAVKASDTGTSISAPVGILLAAFVGALIFYVVRKKKAS